MTSEDGVEVKFVLGDLLPTYYDVAISIFSVASKPGTAKMKSVIRSYAFALIDMWEKSFTNRHVLGRNAVIERLEKLVKLYYSKVYVVSNRESKKHEYDSMLPAKSIRSINKDWKKTSIQYTINRRLTSFPITSLMDIIKDKEDLKGVEKVFYHDQNNARICRLSEEIDLKWVEEQLVIIQRNEIQQQDEANISDGEESATEDMDTDNTELNTSRTRSGRVLVAKFDAGTQTEFVHINNCKPAIRVTRDCTTEIKKTCAMVSVKVSTSLAPVAVQTVCQELYGHQYYLTKAEAIEKDPSLAVYREEVSELPEKRRRFIVDERKQKNPLSKRQDYIPYKNVLPSARTINDYKQMMAIQSEADAANALFNKKDTIRCTLHYDTTSRSKIDGEWPSIIFSFSDKQRYVLRPIFFAYEDRVQITKLIIETFERLALLVNESNEEMPNAKTLWEKVDMVMTDSVEKNLHIENGIAAGLNSTHIPLHLLCKAHTVEALDRSNINVLAELEATLKFREALESINPGIYVIQHLTLFMLSLPFYICP